MLMNSLPVGGTITRIACGSDDPAHASCAWLMPSACDGLGLALVDRLDAGPDDLRHVGAPRSGRGPAARPGTGS